MSWSQCSEIAHGEDISAKAEDLPLDSYQGVAVVALVGFLMKHF